MARSSARSAATERAYLQFAPPPHGVAGGPAEEFDESDIWGSFNPSGAASEGRPAEPTARVRAVPSGAWPPARKPATKPVGRSGGGGAAHGSLPVNIPDWSKILGDEYRAHHTGGGDWDVDDADDEDVEVVPPHELAWRRRAASLSVHQGAGVVGRTLKVRDAIWKKTTGFQD